MTWLSFRLAYFAGKDAFEKENWAKAETELSKSLSIKPGHYEASLLLAQTRWKLGKKEAARALLASVPESDATGGVYYHLGNFHADSGELEDAFAAFQKSVHLDPKNSDAWYELGKTCLRLENGSEAVAAFRRVAALEPYLAVSRLQDLKSRKDAPRGDGSSIP